MNTVILLAGPPASGKSTWANNYVKMYPNAIIVCRDDIRAMQGFPPIGSDDQERVVTKIQNGMIEIGLAEGRDVVVANTNVSKQSRKALIKFAHEHGADVNVVIFDTDLDECIRRNAARERFVPEDVIRKMYDSMNAQIKNGSLSAEVIPAPAFAEYKHDPNKGDAYIFDIDNTIAAHNRSPYDYGELHTDSPIDDVVRVMHTLSSRAAIVFLTGRPEEYRSATTDWLQQNVWPYDVALFMRPTGDKRPDSIVKNETIDRDILPRYNIAGVFEDRDRVVRALRSRGITVFQPAYGNF